MNISFSNNVSAVSLTQLLQTSVKNGLIKPHEVLKIHKKKNIWGFHGKLLFGIFLLM